MHGVDIVIEPRKLWPSGGSRRGKIGGLGEGRAVAFADDAGWSEELLALQRTGYGSIPPELLAGAVEALRRWSKVWPQRPVAVVAAPALLGGDEGQPCARRSTSPASASCRCSTCSAGTAPAVPTDSSPAARSSRTSNGRSDSTRRSRCRDGPVLLCATTMRTGWSLTVSGALLHDAGCAAALPLVIHRLP